jgi:hypothetical protein
MMMLKTTATTTGLLTLIAGKEFRINTINQATFAILVNWIAIEKGRKFQIVYRDVLIMLVQYFESVRIPGCGFGTTRRCGLKTSPDSTSAVFWESDPEGGYSFFSSIITPNLNIILW